MRTAISPALLILVGLVSSWAATQDQQAKPPAGAGGELTDPTRIAGEKGDAAKPPLSGVAVDSNYIIGPEDVISIWVYQQPSMIGSYTVRSDGMVSVPLIGQIKVGGLTTSQVEAEVVQKLKTGEIVIDPNVTSNVLAVHSKKVYIEGDGIAHTGSMDLVVKTRVSEVIAWAGGFREWAKKTKIRIIRQLPDGTVKKFMYNAKEVSQGKKLEQNIYVESGDHIYVE